jgi:methylenetetrahydrofolate reductase (NADPH)
MKLKEIYAGARPVFSFEFFPPKTAKGEEGLLEEVARLRRLSPSFFSMTYGAGGGTRDRTVSLGRRIRDLSGVETVCHITCVGQSREEVRAVLREIKSLGMENVMALRGDPPPGETQWRPHPDGFVHASELVAEARAMGDFSIAVAGFPEMHPESASRESDLHYLKLKIDAGADAVVTQLFFDNEDFHRFNRDLKSMGVRVPIVPGILPILSAPQVRRFAGLCKARIPKHLDARLREVEGDDEAARRLGVEYAAAQMEDLLDRGVPGVHLYCLNRAQSAEAIFDRLGLRGPAPGQN